jgi:hypothetical protein
MSEPVSAPPPLASSRPSHPGPPRRPQRVRRTVPFTLPHFPPTGNVE